MQDMKISFPEGLKGQFKSLVNSRCGIYFKDYDLKDLEIAITRRMKLRTLDSPLAYYNLLTFSDDKESEFRELLNLLTVKHTYFFRNEPQFKVLREKILTDIISRKKTIRIWSAGCSTGEEPYSIAMTIRDILPSLEGYDIEILATDASTEALENARRGVYGLSSMRLVDEEHKKRYFIEDNKALRDIRYAVTSDVKNMVRYSYFNLMEDEFPSGFDIIFCRNVVIYFELETTIRVMRKFAGSLNSDGYLFIGYSESLQFISDKFKMVDCDEAIFYVKAEEGAAPAIFKKPKHTVAHEFKKAIEDISKAEVEAEIQEGQVKKAHSLKLEKLLIEASGAMHMKKYEQALSVIKEAQALDKDTAEPYYLEAEIYANMGRSREAKEAIDSALKKNALFPPAYYLSGYLSVEEGDVAAAEKSFKKSLYLDSDFSLAHFGLANIYRDSNRPPEAIREYRNTLNILSKYRSYDIIPHSGGFNAATLTGVCKNNIERLKAA